MATPSYMDSRKLGFTEGLLGAACAGASAGVVAALLDVFQAREVLPSLADKSVLFFHAAARAAFFGMLLGASAATFASVGERLLSRKSTRRAGGASLFARTVGITAAIAPGCIYTAVRLFQGGLTSRLPWRGALTAAAALVLVLLVFVGVRIALELIRRADRRTGFAPLYLTIGLCFAAASAAAHFADGHFYRRLYLYLHGILGLLTLTGFALFFRLNLFRPADRTGKWKRYVGLFATLALGFVLSLMTLGSRQTIKLAAFENTSTLANLMQVFSVSVAAEHRSAPSPEIAARQKARERAARIASQGDFPVFPGAHILMISVDALRADRLGMYGYEERALSPKLDAWANSSGIIFDRAYCTAPHSSYSISSLHTGRFIHDDVMFNKEIAFPTLAGALRDAGYETYGFYTQGIFFTEGENVAHYRRNRFEIEHVFNGAPGPDELTDRVIAEMERAVLKGEPPLFLWAHYFNVHEPYRSTRFGNSPSDRYDGEIVEADAEVARLIETAKKTLSKDIIVVFTADHGEEFKDHGGYYHGSTLYDEQMRVPLLFALPDATPRRVLSPVSTAAIAPTLLRLTGNAPPSTMVSYDLRPAIFGGDAAHVETPVFAAVTNQHMAVRLPYKLIMDPAGGRFELYNLAEDPKERFNLYDKHRDVAADLRGEIEAFLDTQSKGESLSRTVLNLGNARDPRAVPGLVSLMSAPTEDPEERAEAAELLGVIRDYETVPALKNLLTDEDERVAFAAAESLSRLGDLSGEDLLLDALMHQDATVRDKAALALGRHRRTEAVPQLIEALGRGDDTLRNNAIRTLGILRDKAAVEPLLDLIHLVRYRYLIVLSLGMIGDMRAYEPMMDLIDNDTHTDVRNYAIGAVGRMGAREAIPRLLRVLVEEPEIRWTAESLVRLDAVGTAPLFGTDIRKNAPALRGGFGRCIEREETAPHEFLNHTTCETAGPRAEVAFPVDADDRTILIFRARLTETAEHVVSLEIRINGTLVGETKLTGEFSETRIEIPKERFISPPALNHVTMKLDRKGRFELDHVLAVAADEIN